MPSVAPENKNPINSNEFIAQKLKEIDEKEKKQSEKIIIENNIKNEKKPEIIETKKEPEIVKDNKMSDAIKLINSVNEKSIDEEKINNSKTSETAKPTEESKSNYNPNLRLGGKSVKLSDIKSNSDSLGLFKNKKTVFIMFIIPPIIISLISAYHLITFYEPANPFSMSVILAFAIELASISSLVALGVLDKLKKGTVWSIFLVLVILQILGNTFHSFVYLQEQTELAKLLFNFLSLDNSLSSYRIVSLLMGMPLPLISLAFIKGSIEYLE